MSCKIRPVTEEYKKIDKIFKEHLKEDLDNYFSNKKAIPEFYNYDNVYQIPKTVQCLESYKPYVPFEIVVTNKQFQIMSIYNTPPYLIKMASVSADVIFLFGSLAKTTYFCIIKNLIYSICK